MGFNRGHTADDVVGFIREMIVAQDRWGLGNMLIISSQDILTAFDEMAHSQIHQSLHRRGGGSSHDCAAVLWDLHGVQLCMTIFGAGTT